MAQKTVAQLTAEIASELPTNGANLITAADLRGVLVDMVDSAGNLADGTPATLYSADGILAGNRAVDCNENNLVFNDADLFNVSVTGAMDQFRIESGSIDIFEEDGDGQSRLLMEGPSTSFTSDFSINFTVPSDASMTFSGTGGGAISIGTSIADQVGFLGSAPTPQTANANQAVATDGPSNLVLSNAIRAELIARGFWKGSA